MCGRFLLTAPAEALHRLFGFPELPNLTARFNVAPGQAIAAMRLADDQQRHFVWLRWGLVPSWARAERARAAESQGKPHRSAPLINARAETVAVKPSFRDAFESRRCVVFADGFYEWRQYGNRQPYCVRLADDSPFAFAALWEPAGPDPATEDQAVRQSCALITTEANAKMATVHHRMPVILTPEKVGAWLDPDSAAQDLQAMLKPLPDEAVTLTPVSKRVNAVKNDDAGLLKEERLPETPDQLKLL